MRRANLKTKKLSRMEKEFTKWFKANEKRFSHGQFDEKQIAYASWLEGQKQALRIPNVVGQSEQLLAFLEWIDQSPEENAGRSREDLVKDYLSQLLPTTF